MVVHKCLPVTVYIIMYILCAFLTCSVFCKITWKKGEEKKVDKKKRKEGRKKRWEGGKEKERSEEGRKWEWSEAETPQCRATWPQTGWWLSFDHAVEDDPLGDGRTRGREPWSLNDHTELIGPPTSQSTSLGPHLGEINVHLLQSSMLRNVFVTPALPSYHN